MTDTLAMVTARTLSNLMASLGKGKQAADLDSAIDAAKDSKHPKATTKG